MLNALLLTLSIGAVQNPAPPQSKAEIQHQKDLQNDIEAGKKFSVEVEKELKLSKNQEMADRINRIASGLAEIARVTPVKVTWGDKRLNPFPYTFKLLEDTDVNAFSLPGGSIYINEGLLKFIESDDELAGVIAHEIAHASLRHLATLQKEAAKLSSWTLPAILVAIFAGGRAAPDAIFATRLFEQSQSSGWSQKAESAADYAGLQYLLQSKYNPTGILTFMERLARGRDVGLENGVDQGIFRTHPPSKERATELVKQMAAAKVPVQRSAVTTSFSMAVKKVADDKFEAWFGPRRIYTFVGDKAQIRAEAAAARVNQFFDQTPEMFEIVIRKDGAVVGRNRVLFRIEPGDASELKVQMSQLEADTVQALRRTASYLSLVWLARG
ncbi:MAG: M48 family metalloprotease [Fimbriimonadaceae bacterium]